MASASNGNMSAPKAVRPATNNRQSVQNNGPVQRDAAGGVPSFNAAVVPPTTQAPPSYQSSQPMQQQQSEVRRATPQPAQTSDDLSEEDVAQLVKDHKELRTSSTRNCTCEHSTNILSQARSTPRSRSTISKRKIRSSSYRTAWLTSAFHNHEPRLTTANTPLALTDSMDLSHSLHSASGKTGRAYPHGW